MKDRFVSINIPVYQRFDLLSRCIESIERFTDFNYELVIIDDGSTEKAVKKFIRRKADVLVDHATNLGIAASRMNGVLASNGDYICELDSDVVLTPGWLTKLVSALEDRWIDREATVVVAAALLSCQVGYFLSKSDSVNSFGLIQVETVGTACTLFRSTLIDIIGNFDPKLYNLWSDMDFCKRINQHGDEFDAVPKVVIDPKTMVYHHGWVNADGEMSEQTDANTRSLDELNDREHKIKHLASMKLIYERWGVKHPGMDILSKQLEGGDS
jgi:GT2 family glycosyltransferase